MKFIFGFKCFLISISVLFFNQKLVGQKNKESTGKFRTGVQYDKKVIIVEEDSKEVFEIDRNFYVNSKDEIQTDYILDYINEKKYSPNNIKTISINGIYHGAKTLGQKFDTFNVSNLSELEHHFSISKGKTIILIGQIEDYSFTFYNNQGNQKFLLELNELLELATQYNIDILPIGVVPKNSFTNPTYKINLRILLENIQKEIYSKSVYEVISKIRGRVNQNRIVIDVAKFEFDGQLVGHRMEILQNPSTEFAFLSANVCMFFFDSEENVYEKINYYKKKRNSRIFSFHITSIIIETAILLLVIIFRLRKDIRKSEGLKVPPYLKYVIILLLSLVFIISCKIIFYSINGGIGQKVLSTGGWLFSPILFTGLVVYILLSCSAFMFLCLEQFIHDSNFESKEWEENFKLLYMSLLPILIIAFIDIDSAIFMIGIGASGALYITSLRYLIFNKNKPFWLLGSDKKENSPRKRIQKEIALPENDINQEQDHLQSFLGLKENYKKGVISQSDFFEETNKILNQILFGKTDKVLIDDIKSLEQSIIDPHIRNLTMNTYRKVKDNMNLVKYSNILLEKDLVLLSAKQVEELIPFYME